MQLGRRAQFEDEPGAEVVVEVEEDGEGQQEEADEDPPLVNHHVFETFDSDPQQEDEDQPRGVQQRLHGPRTGRVRFRAAGELEARALLFKVQPDTSYRFSNLIPGPSITSSPR